MLYPPFPLGVAKCYDERTALCDYKVLLGKGVLSTFQSKLTYQLISLQVRGVLGDGGYSWNEEGTLAGKEVEALPRDSLCT